MKPDWLKKLTPPPEKKELRYHLHKRLSGRNPGRSLKNVHASDVIDDDGWWCPRDIAITLSKGDKPKPEHVSTANALVYFQGNQLAQYVIQSLADELEVVGDWACTHCAARFKFQTRPDHCDAGCGSETFEHIEVRFLSDLSGVSGGIDVLVRFPGDELLTVVEIKTLQKEEFKEQAAPVGKHKLRTNYYMRLAEEAGYADRINVAEARILYITKGGWGVQSDDPPGWGFDDAKWTPFKEYRIPRDDKQTDHPSSLATRLKKWKEEGGPWPEGICPSQGVPRAQRCSNRKPCWEAYKK